jgi:hypothetical protein
MAIVLREACCGLIKKTIAFDAKEVCAVNEHHGIMTLSRLWNVRVSSGGLSVPSMLKMRLGRTATSRFLAVILASRLVRRTYFQVTSRRIVVRSPVKAATRACTAAAFCPWPSHHMPPR